MVLRNKHIERPSLIAEKLQEFETRIETALHYKIPYPRPTNVAPGATGKDPEVVTPVYLHSYKHESGGSSQTRSRAQKAPVYEE